MRVSNELGATGARQRTAPTASDADRLEANEGLRELRGAIEGARPKAQHLTIAFRQFGGQRIERDASDDRGSIALSLQQPAAARCVHAEHLQQTESV